MKKKRLIIIIAVMTAFIMGAETTVVSAASLSEIREEIQDKESELSKGESEEKSLASEVTELEGQIADMESSISELDSAIADAESELSGLESDLAKAEKKVKTQNKNLDSRLRNMYKSGSVGFLDVLFNSNSFSEFLTNLDMIEKIYNSDQEVLVGLQESYDEIEAKRDEVKDLKAELSESKEVAETEKSNLESERASVEEKKAQISASNEETEKMLDELNADANRITSVIQSSTSSSSSSGSSGSTSSSGSSKSSGTGRLSWPCSGTITSEQGWRIHPIYGYLKYHSGMDIAVPTGTPIKAAAAGTVTMATYYGGYGNCVMIDHGGGLVTLYGHNSSFAVSSGQKVSRGQVIAYAGSTGDSTGPHCHFEVRVNGTAVNPRDYL